MIVDWSDRRCFDCGADTSWLGMLCPWIKGKGWLCPNCWGMRNNKWFTEKLLAALPDEPPPDEPEP